MVTLYIQWVALKLITEIAMGTHAQGVTTSTEDKVRDLLGMGIEPSVVALTLGISPSRVSQLLSDEQFAISVTELRFHNLQKHNARDASYDELEDKLLTKLNDILIYMTKPSEVLNAIRTINNAKRRGSSTPQSITNQQNVVKLVMPTTIINQFVTNGHNQVVQAGDQELVTMHATNLLELTKEKNSGSIPTNAKLIPSAEETNDANGKPNEHSQSRLDDAITQFKEKHSLA